MNEAAVRAFGVPGRDAEPISSGYRARRAPRWPSSGSSDNTRRSPRGSTPEHRVAGTPTSSLFSWRYDLE